MTVTWLNVNQSGMRSPAADHAVQASPKDYLERVMLSLRYTLPPEQIMAASEIVRVAI